MSRSFLSTLLISLGALIVIGFMALGIAPYFIDWNQYRSEIEASISDRLGDQVVIGGDISGRLLPSPRLSLGSVRLGTSDQPGFVSQSLNADFDLAGLIGGQVTVTSLVLDQPEVRINRNEYGALSLPGLKRLDQQKDILAKIGVSRLEITEGRVTVADSEGKEITKIESINGTASLGSLLGPYSFEGSGRWRGERFDSSLELDKQGAEGSRLQLRFSQGSRPLVVALRGILKLKAGEPDFRGKASITWFDQQNSKPGDQEIPKAWEIESSFSMSGVQAELPEIALQLGEAYRHARFQGAFSIEWADDPIYRLSLGAKHLQLGEPGASPSAEGYLAPLVLAIRQQISAWPPGWQGRIQVAIPTVEAGGKLVQDFNLDLEQTIDTWALRNLSAKIPGDANLTVTSLEVGQDAENYRGEIKFDATNTDEAFRWLFGENVRFGAEATRFVSTNLTTSFQRRGQAWTLSDLSLLVGASDFSGSVETEIKNGQRVTRIAGNSSSIDLDFLREQFAGNVIFEALSEQYLAERLDLILGVDNTTIFGTDVNDISLQAQIQGRDVMLQQLQVKDFQGLSIVSSGNFVADLEKFVSQLTFQIKGEKIDFVRRWVDWHPGIRPLADWLDTRAQLFAPLNLSARLDVSRTPVETAINTNIRGKIGDSQLTVESLYTVPSGDVNLIEAKNGELALEYYLDHPDGQALLSAVTGLPWQDSKEGDFRIRGNLSGNIGAEFQWTQEIFSLGGWSLIEGQLRQLSPWLWFTDKAELDSSLSFTFDKFPVWPLLQPYLGPPPSGEGATLGSGSFVLVTSPKSLRSEDVNLELGELNMQGSFDLDRIQQKAQGDFHFTELDLLSLVSLFGQAPLVDEKGNWSDQAFGGGIKLPFEFDASLNVDLLSIGEVLQARTGELKLAFHNDEIKTTLVTASLAGGEILGDFALGSEGNNGTYVSLSAELVGLHAEDLLWRWNNRAVLEGELDGALVLSGRGISPAGLAASLTGSGELKIQPGKIRGLSGTLLKEVLRSVDAGVSLSGEKLRNLVAQHLDAHELPFTAIDSQFSIESGLIRSELAKIEGLPMKVDVNVIADLGEQAIDSEWTLEYQDKEVANPPRLGLTFTGPLKKPVRKIDIAPLEAYLNLRAFEKNVDEIKRLEDKIAEDAANLKAQSNQTGAAPPPPLPENSPELGFPQ